MFKKCSLCNGLIRNLNDLKIHLKEAHGLDDYSLDKVIETVDKQNDEETTKLTYDEELARISMCLNMESLKNAKFIELNLLIGKTFFVDFFNFNLNF